MPEPQDIHPHKADEQAKLRRSNHKAEKLKKSRWLISASVILYLISLSQAGYYSCVTGGSTCSAEDAASLLFFGWMGIFDGIYSWFANPALMAGWLLCYLRKFNEGRIVSIVSALLMLSFLLYTEIETGTTADVYVKSYGAGYILWIASSLVLCAACEVGMKSLPRMTT